MPSQLRLGLVAFAAIAVSAYDNGVAWAAKPPRGWSSWCTDDICGLIDFCNETEVLSVADSMVSQGLPALNYSLVLLDDCWADVNRDGNGDIQPDPSRFPSGIDYLVNQLHNRGLYLGLYTCAGERTCKNNRTGSGGHYEADAKWFARHNVDFIKMDNCGHPGTPPAEYYGNFSAYLNATGKSIFFNTCNWGEDAPWNWAPAIAQSFRNGPDHLPIWNWNLTDGNQGVINIIETMASIGNLTGPYAWSDPDFLEGGEVLTPTESQTEFAAWAMFGGPMVIATDLRSMPAWKAAMVTNAEILALNHDDLLSPGYRVRSSADGTQLWAKALASGSVAVMLLNADDTNSRAITVSSVDVGWPAGASFSVRDLWAHASLGTVSGSYTAAAVPVHGNSMLLLSKV